MNDVSLVQIIYCLKNLTINLPFEFFILGAWVLLKEVFESLAFAVLHLDIKDLYSVFAALFTKLTEV